MRSFESREDYLEAILVLQNEKGAVRSIDIAAKLGFTKPWAFCAVRNTSRWTGTASSV